MTCSFIGIEPLQEPRMSHSRFQLHITRHTAIAALCVAVPSALAGGPIAYTFVNVADSSGPLSTFMTNAVINDVGTVAFLAGTDAGSIGLFRTDGSGGLITIAVAGPGQPYAQLGGPGLNNLNAVAFRGDDVAGSRIFVHANGAITPITPGWPYTNVGELPSINDGGTVVFTSNYFATYSGIYTGNGGEVSMKYENSQGAFTSFGDPAINNDGTIGFLAAKVGGGLGVYIGTGLGYTTIADTDDEPSAFGSVVDINTDGTVVFEATRDSGGTALYTGNPRGFTPVVTTNDGFSLSIGNIGRSINDSGDIAFVSSITGTGQFGIFTGPDLVQDKVIKTGETLFGSTVVNIECVRGALNNNGDVAFEYALSNGKSGIAVAKAPNTAIPGDVTGNGEVDVDDLLAVINSWGSCPAPCPPHCAADIAPAGGNCAVDVDDLLMVINNWG